MKRYIPTHLKHANRRILYEMIAQRGMFSRAQLSRESQISSPTVLRTMNYFLEKGIVSYVAEPVKPTDGTLGRVPNLMRFEPGFAFAAAIEIEGEQATVGLLDMAGQVLHTRHLQDNHDILDRLAKLPDVLAEVCRETDIPMNKLLGVGIGIPGVLAREEGIIRYAPLIGVKKPLDVSQELARIGAKIGALVVIENDVNAAAWGEYRVRAGEWQDICYITLGTGLGAGIVLNGELRRGTGGQAGEIGYNCFETGAENSREQAGWLERRISLPWLRQRYGFGPSSQAASGEMLEEVAEYLALSIANFQAAMDVGAFVLGGLSVQAFGAPLLERIQGRVEDLCVSVPDVGLARLAEPGLVGLGQLVGEAALLNLLREDDA